MQLRVFRLQARVHIAFHRRDFTLDRRVSRNPVHRAKVKNIGGRAFTIEPALRCLRAALDKRGYVFRSAGPVSRLFPHRFGDQPEPISLRDRERWNISGVFCWKVSSIFPSAIRHGNPLC